MIPWAKAMLDYLRPPLRQVKIVIPVVECEACMVCSPTRAA